MKLLLVVAYFVPEIGSAAHVYFDLAKAFVKKGHEVHIITSYPRDFNLNKKDVGKIFPLDDVIDGIHIHRCRHPTQRDNVILRGFEHFVLSRYYFKKYKSLNINFNAVLMYIPPLPLWNLAKKIKRYDGTPSILNFQDFHPQELVDVGVMKNPIWIKIMEYIEKRAYKNADYITVLSKQGVNYVVQRGGDPSKISHIYNGMNPDEFKNKKVKADFKKKQGIKDKTLVTYAGILSPYQGIDTILNTAKKMKTVDDVVFYIIGDGAEKDHIQQRIKYEKVSNVRLLPLQDRAEYFNIIESSDIALVTLDKRMKAPCLPGKIKDILVFKKPIIASVSKETETADFINQSQAGFVVSPESICGLYDKIILLKDNGNLSYIKGKNGYNFLEKNMDLETNVKKYVKIFGHIT